MQTLYFQLERSKTLKDGSHPIYLVLKIKEGGKEKRFRHYTGRTSSKVTWIGEGDSKRVSSKANGATITNSRLETLRQGADAILTNASNLKHPITIEYFRDRFRREVLGIEATTAEAPHKGFFAHFDEFIVNRKSILQPSTIKTYQTLKTSLLDFEKEQGWKVDFSTINGAFCTLYTKYLIEDNELLNNTLAKRMATLKAFLREMKIEGVNKFDHYEMFKASRDTETTVMYLTESELSSLEKYQLKAGTTEAHVRDAFCFSCHTGLRFSDWDKVKPENIIQAKSERGEYVTVLQFTMHKVHRVVRVPLSKTAIGILQKYPNWNPGETIIPLYTNQETNRTLKAVSKEAKINEVIREVKKSGSKRVDHVHPKHEILSCHDARNTMATIYLEKGGRPEVLQKLLGHSNIKQTMRYVKIVDKAVYTDFEKTMKSGKIIQLKKPA